MPCTTSLLGSPICTSSSSLPWTRDMASRLGLDWLVSASLISFPQLHGSFPSHQDTKMSLKFVCQARSSGSIKFLPASGAVANDVIKPHDIFDASEESPTDLTFCHTILLVSCPHTHTIASCPAVRGSSIVPICKCPIHPPPPTDTSTGDEKRATDPYDHMFISDPKSFAFDCAELRPPSNTAKLQNSKTQLHSSHLD